MEYFLGFNSPICLMWMAKYVSGWHILPYMKLVKLQRCLKLYFGIILETIELIFRYEIVEKIALIQTSEIYIKGENSLGHWFMIAMNHTCFLDLVKIYQYKN